VCVCVCRRGYTQNTHTHTYTHTHTRVCVCVCVCVCVRVCVCRGGCRTIGVVAAPCVMVVGPEHAMLEADARAVKQVALLVVVAPAALLGKPLARPVYGAAAERAGREPGLRGGCRPERLAGTIPRPSGTRSRYQQQSAQCMHDQFARRLRTSSGDWPRGGGFYHPNPCLVIYRLFQKSGWEMRRSIHFPGSQRKGVGR